MAGVRLRSLHGNKLYNRDKPCIGTTFMHTPVNQNKSRTDLSQWWREFRTLLVLVPGYHSFEFFRRLPVSSWQ
jgi:hypothetical protein